MGEKIKKYPVFWIIIIVLLFFVGTVNYLNEPFYNWLSASSIKFTNNWLNDGIKADQFTMLERPASIESTTVQDRHPYISYPNGDVLLCYSLAKLLGYKQIDMSFIKPLGTFIYLLDALLISLLIYLFLTYIFKIKSRYQTIILSVFLSCTWIFLPINIFYLKNVFFADQLVLFFIYLFLALELLKSFVPIAKSSIRLLINSLLFICIFFGMLIEYYFWFQVFVVISIHVCLSLIKKEKVIPVLKNLLIYIVPAGLAIFVFLFQIIHIDHWKDILFAKFSERTGQSGLYVIIIYLLRIVYHTYKTYKVIGLLLFAASGAALIYLSRKKILNEIHRQTLLFSIMVILPVFIQLLVFMNHSAEHEFSLLKLGFPFILGIMLIAYSLSYYKKKSTEYFFLISIILITGYSLYNQANTGDFFNLRFANDESGRLKGFEPIIEELNDYNHVFFSFTDSIPQNPPLSIAVTKKMLYKINTISDIKEMFPHLNPDAKVFILTNQNAIKNEQTLQNEQQAIEHAKLIKEAGQYAAYELQSSE